ncbi:alpha/beta-hydrolase [Patellaria atrata CBS 101060]|uniref:Alpha/beta-hydrolase n=1 Tax=Patellaria atrata CBS 101060 TaxID=1346257 RepID=A0A9P4SK75_9PEZI|nr:alpha/beta-hydrolase [Patellaria atrata CBS 101060]
MRFLGTNRRSTIKSSATYVAQSPQIRRSATVGSALATGIPDSGFAFVHNSQGASAAISELSKELDGVLEKLDWELEPDIQVRIELSRLEKEAGRYRNSRLQEDDCDVYNITSNEGHIVSLTWALSASIYEPENELDVPGYTFENTKIVYPSLDGTIKAIRFDIVNRYALDEERNIHFPALVVSIRGTASGVDTMVNLNGRGKNVDDFIDISVLQTEEEHTLSNVRAHGGFLTAARALKGRVEEQLEKAWSKGVKNVIFTGHSAGGAVASLLFLRYALLTIDKYSGMKISLITFGAPPVITPNLSSILEQGESKTSSGLCMNIINEYDVVSRADSSYIRSLVDLYRSVYSLPPVGNEPLMKAIEGDKERPFLDKEPLTKTAGVLLSESFSTLQSFRSDVGSEGQLWPVPRAEYYHIGPIIIIKVQLELPSSIGDDGGEPKLTLKLLKLRKNVLEKLLWCRIEVHRRMMYTERIRMIADGEFHTKT